MTGTGCSVQPATPRGAWLLGYIAPVVVLYLLVRNLGGGLVDDAYIFCRYAENTANGNGAVFNVGERVEGYTSPAHMLLIAACAAAGMDAPAAAGWISMLAAAACLLLLSHASGTMSGSALVALSALPFALWSSTGMDASLSALAVLVAVLMIEQDLKRDGSSGVTHLTWLIIGCTVFVRPEGLVLWASAILLSLRRMRLPSALLGPLLGLLPAAGLTAFRILYYGDWLPNTFHAKVGGGGSDLWMRGILYLGDAAIGLAPIIALAAAGALRKARAGHLDACALIALGLAAAVVFEGGDHFPMHRLLVPMIPILSLAANRFIFSLDLAPRVRVFVVAGAVGLTALCGLDASRLDKFRLEVVIARTWDHIGRVLSERFGAGHSIALTNAGAIPYRTGWQTIDMIGLLDRRIASLPVRMGQGYPGHEKFDSEYVLSREPDFILLHQWIWGSIVPDEVAIRRVNGDANLDMAISDSFRARYRLRWIAMPGGFLALYENTRSFRSSSSHQR